MSNLNPRQFRMQTNIKAASGSQGTLFQGGNPSPARGGQPWPRAYSPERREQVVQAMGFTDARGKALLRPNRGKAGTTYLGPEEKRDYSQGIETIARSTVPLEHIQGLEAEFGTTRQPGAERGGTYYGLYKGRGAFDVTRGHAQTKVPIHEIGHHVSNITGTAHSVSQRGPADVDERTHYYQRGQEEGFAENYAETHYRDQRGRPAADFNTAPGWWRDSYRMTDEHDPEGNRFYHFARGFANEREKSPSAQRRNAQHAAMANPPSPSGIRGQQPLLHRVTKQGEYINARGDRGPDKVSWSYANLDADPQWMTSHPWRVKK